MSRKPLLVVFLCLAVLGWLHCPPADAGISISPAVISVDLDKQARPAGEFVIRNTGDTTERYRIMASHFEIGRGGELNKVEPNENSLANWIKFNPREFTLPPKSRRSIRFVVIPEGRIADRREYWCFMELESLVQNEATATDSLNRTMTVRVVPSILVPIFAKKGKVPYGAEISKSTISGEAAPRIESVLVNTGRGHLFVDGVFEVLDASGDIIQEGGMGRTYLMPGNERMFRAGLRDDLPEGEYVVRLEYSSSQLSDPVRDEISFNR